MVILLVGSTQLARAAIATRMVKEDGQWRHLAVEELAEIEPLDTVEEKERSDVMLRIACKCAEELENQGYHVIISGDYRPSILAMARSELERIIGVHVGPQYEIEGSEFPHVLDAKTATASDVHEILLSFDMLP